MFIKDALKQHLDTFCVLKIHYPAPLEETRFCNQTKRGTVMSPVRLKRHQDHTKVAGDLKIKL